jgi:hypothetical protein
MPRKGNTALVAKFLDELWNKRNLDAIDQFTVEDYVVHIPQGDLLGREALKSAAESYFGIFSLIHLSVVDQTSQDSQVVTRIQWDTTLELTDQRLHQEIERTILARGVSIDRIDNGRIAESWNMLDWLYYGFNLQELSRNPDFVQILLALSPCDQGRCPLGQHCVNNNYCQADVGHG